MITVAAIVPLNVQVAPASAADAANFNPSLIIADAYFYDANAMSAVEIQNFLDAKIGSCSNGSCLNMLQVNFAGAAQSVSSRTGNLICSAVTAGTTSVAQFIFQVQQSCGISARVVLVTLQKEEALITGSDARAPSQARLNIAMGYACPDTAACDTRYYGVANQIYWAAWQFKVYSAARFGKQPGNNYIQYSPAASCGGTTLNIQNNATAALYNYTPYQPNGRALANLYGTGDGCSAYGNRNFWVYYSDWFGNPLGNSPVGWLDSATVSGSTLTAEGWSIDTDVPAGAVPVQLQIDGIVVDSTFANTNRPGLGAAVLPQAGDNHGYVMTGAVAVGPHTVCVVALDVGYNGGGAPAKLSHSGSDAVNNCAVITVSAPPVGWLDSISLLGSAVTVAGWSIDPDTASPVQVLLKVDDRSAAAGTADVSRPGLGSAINSAAGDNHGFSLSGTLTVGSHTICVVAVNDAPGPNGNILYAGPGASNNCAIVNYSGPRSPMGWVDSASLLGSTVTVKGWSIDPDTASAVQVQLVVDGAVVVSGAADANRPGLGAAILPGVGDNHGYSLATQLSVGAHTVCVVGLDDASGPSSRLLYNGPGASNNCAIVNYSGPRSPMGWVDSASLLGSTVTVKGWSIDPDTASAVQVQLVVDGAVVVSGAADANRPGLGAAILPGVGDNHGYSLATQLSVGAHTVCVVGLDDASGPSSRLLYNGPGASNNCAIVNYSGPRSPMGWVDSASLLGSTVTVKGWSIDPDTASAVQVQLVVDGAVVVSGAADANRPGLGAAILPGVGDNHGYSLATQLSVGAHTVCVVGLDDASGPSSRLLYNGPGASNNCAVVTRP